MRGTESGWENSYWQSYIQYCIILHSIVQLCMWVQRVCPLYRRALDKGTNGAFSATVSDTLTHLMLRH